MRAEHKTEHREIQVQVWVGETWRTVKTVENGDLKDTAEKLKRERDKDPLNRLFIGEVKQPAMRLVCVETTRRYYRI